MGLDKVAGASLLEGKHGDFHLIGESRFLSSSKFYKADYNLNGELENVSLLPKTQSDCFMHKAFFLEAQSRIFVSAFGDDSLYRSDFNNIYDSLNQIIWSNPLKGYFTKNAKPYKDSIVYGPFIKRHFDGTNWNESEHFGIMNSRNFIIKTTSINYIFGFDSLDNSQFIAGSTILNDTISVIGTDVSNPDFMTIVTLTKDLSIINKTTIPSHGAYSFKWTKSVGNISLILLGKSSLDESEYTLYSINNKLQIVWKLNPSSSIITTDNQNKFPLYSTMRSANMIGDKFDYNIHLVKLHKDGSTTPIKDFNSNYLSIFDFTPILYLNDRILCHLSTAQVQPFNQLLLQMDTNGCFYKSDFETEYLCNSIYDYHFSSDSISIGPNPVSDFISINSFNEKPVWYSMYNYSGQLIFEGELIENIMLNVETIPPGLYFLYFENESVTTTKKVIIWR